MPEKLLLITQFSGGLSSGSKRGLAGSFRFGNGLDIHQDPDKLQIMPASTKDSGTTVVDLPMFATTNTVNSNIYFLGDAGNIYARTSAGSWSIIQTLTNAEGLGFFSGTNLIYGVSDDTQFTIDPATDSVSTGYRTLNSADYHPIEPFLDKIFTGNGRELVSTDASAIDYDSTTRGGGITVDYNYKIRCLKNIGDWLFIGCSSDNSSAAKYFLWDGVSDDYNYARTLMGEDGINAVEITDDGTVLVFAGKKGHTYQLISIDIPLKRIKRATLPRIEKDKTIEVYPGSTTGYQGHILFAPSAGTSLTAEKGVYSWTSGRDEDPMVLNLDYSISTKTTTGTGVKIGCLLGANSTELFIGWKDGSSYGVDLIDGTGAQGVALFESLIHDDGEPDKIKHYKQFDIKLAGDLATGEVITLYYKAERGSWTSIGTLDYSVDEAINQKTFKPDIRAYELEIKLAFANSGSTAPTIDSITVIFEPENYI